MLGNESINNTLLQKIEKALAAETWDVCKKKLEAIYVGGLDKTQVLATYHELKLLMSRDITIEKLSCY